MSTPQISNFRPKVVLASVSLGLLVTVPIEVFLLRQVDGGDWSAVKALAVGVSILTLVTALTTAIQATSNYAKWSTSKRDVLLLTTVVLGITGGALGLVGAFVA